jgi:hypothetical protein
VCAASQSPQSVTPPPIPLPRAHQPSSKPTYQEVYADLPQVYADLPQVYADLPLPKSKANTGAAIVSQFLQVYSY